MGCGVAGVGGGVKPPRSQWAPFDGYDLTDTSGVFAYGVEAVVDGGIWQFHCGEVIGLQSCGVTNRVHVTGGYIENFTGNFLSNVAMKFIWPGPVS